MHICHLIALFIKFLHMFLLHDVVSAAIAGIAFIALVLSVTSVTTELTENIEHDTVLQIILGLLMTYHICIACIHIYSYI